MVTKQTGDKLIAAQQKEITESLIYRELSRLTRDEHNKKVLSNIADDEVEDYELWKNYTKINLEPERLKIFQYILISRIFGLTFTIKLLEKDSKRIREAYEFLSSSIPNGKVIIESRLAREKVLIALIDEERLKYIGAMVLGLSDAIIELTGVLAGFTLALQNTRLIAVAGLITGIAAALSMAASVYLSTESEKSALKPARSAFYTGFTYIITVLFLVYPFFIFHNPYLGLTLTIFDAILVIVIFTYYSSVAQDIMFGRKLRRMTVVCLGIAALTFGIGFAVRIIFNVSV